MWHSVTKEEVSKKVKFYVAYFMNGPQKIKTYFYYQKLYNFLE